MKTLDEQLDVQRLRLEAGDVLAIFAVQRLSQGQVERIGEVVKGVLPGVRCLVLDAGMKLAVITPAEAEALEDRGAA